MSAQISDIHQFLRSSMPGYAFWTVLLIPAIVDYSAFAPRFPGISSAFGLAAIVISSPFFGQIFYHLYYAPFPRYYIRTGGWGTEFESNPSIGPSIEKVFGKDKYKFRALYDLIYFDNRNKWIRDRVDYLFTSFHSLGASVFAVWIAFAFWFVYPSVGMPISFELAGFVGIVLIIVTTVFLFHWHDRYNLSRPIESMIVIQNIPLIRKYLRSFETRSPFPSRVSRKKNR